MSNKKKTVRRVAASTALGVGLVAGGAGIASATSSPTPRDSTTSTSTRPNPANFAGGVVTAVTATSVTVDGMSGTSATYAITSATTFSEGPTTIAASALAVGQHVGIQVSSSDATTAVNVDIQLPVLVGTVTGVNGDTITITDPQGFTRTIAVDSSTSYSKSSGTASLSDVSVGSQISAEGAVDANGTSLDASSVHVGVPTGSGGGPGGGPGFGVPGFGGPGLGPMGGNGSGPAPQ
jgi:hypothetical protein